MTSSNGLSLVETVVVVAIAGLAIAAAVPAASMLRNGGRLAAGSRELALTLQATRWKSVARSRAHGLLFERDERGWHWFEVQDGNGNGLRTAELRSGVDRTLSGPHRLEDRVRGVTPGIPAGRSLPRIPPATGTLGAPGDPVRFGRSDLISFGALGTSSSGTLYLTDGAGALAAVTLFGPTSRIRVWRFDERRGVWTR